MDNTPLTPEDESIFNPTSATHSLRRWHPKLEKLEEYAVIQAMKEYSQQQTATLQARVVELEQWKREAVHVIQGLNMQELGKEIGVPLGKQVTPEVLPSVKQLKSRIYELEDGNTKLHLKCIKDKTEAYKQINAAKQRAEKLIGLLEQEIKGRHWNPDTTTQQYESDWQSYCKEHGLPPTPQSGE